jgi:atypical dual specificity phosphatase
VDNFSWLREGKVAGMARPDPSDAASLQRKGVTALVSLTRRPPFFDSPEWLAVLHLPVADFEPPGQDQLLQAVRFIDSVLDSGGKVAVHCVAGLGRTGTVLAAWLVARGADPADAVDEVRARRPGSIETVEQEHAVHRFAGTWRKAERKERKR